MSIEPLVESLRDATRMLVRAAESADAELVERAVAARGQAVTAVASRLPEVPPDERARVLTNIAADADDAERALVHLAGIGRDGLALLRRRAGAMRGYGADPTEEASALDRAT